MAPFVHKKISEKKLEAFLRPLVTEGEEEPKWKGCPYGWTTKIKGETISYCPKKGALMIQGPDMKAQGIHTRFEQFLENEGKQVAQSTTSSERQIYNEEEMTVQGGQMGSKCGERTIIPRGQMNNLQRKSKGNANQSIPTMINEIATITTPKSQIDDLLLYIR